MGLETASTIDQLVSDWPLQSDKIRQGAGHLRTLKAAIKGTFPNLAGPTTITAATLNALPADFSAVLTELLEHVVPLGSIMMWSGGNATIPTGWALCNGQTISGYGTVPDLRDRFVIGAGGGLTSGQTGGSISPSTTAAGGHTPNIQGHALTAAEGPAHTHVAATFTGSSDDNGDPGQFIVTSPNQSNGTQSSPSFTTSISGSGAPHSHAADAIPDHTHAITDVRPPYYALAYIIKVTQYVAP
jgi:microcystin-dependent protein